VWQTIDYPRASATIASTVNIQGDIAGRYTDAATGQVSGFTRSADGVFTPIRVQGATSTVVRGLNTLGTASGAYRLPGMPPGHHHGLLVDTQGHQTTLDVPGSAHTIVHQLNGQGDLVGEYRATAGGKVLGFCYDAQRQTFTTLDYPHASTLQTVVFGINEAGAMSGSFIDTANVEHAFTLIAGVWAAYDAPGSTRTNADAISESLTTVGLQVVRGVTRGYIRDQAGVFRTLMFPEAQVTVVRSINTRGDTAGRYVRNGVEHGFMRPQEGN
jgi:hypothetical protein